MGMRATFKEEPMKMKVLLAMGDGTICVTEEERPVPGPGEILAKVAHCGICATDIAIADGTLRLGSGMDPVYPVRLGHEWSGVVVETGPGTRRLKPGDRVISDTGYSCGECRYCLEGEYQNCENGKAIGTIGECWPGAFAEYMLMPERLMFRVPDGVELDEAALVEPASIGLYGLLRSPMGPGQNLLVVGTGPIGLGGMACAKAMGSGKIILAGRKDAKLDIGSRMGADLLVNTTKEDLREVVMRETNGRGMDIILDTTGNAGIFNETVRLLRGSGTIVIPGFYGELIEKADIDYLVSHNCTLAGAAGTPNMGRKILDLLGTRKICLSPMITERYPFSKVQEAFDAVKCHNDWRIKIMIDF